MAKKLTPQEQHVKDLILKLLALHKTIAAKPRLAGDPEPQQAMANDLGVERETLNRWLNWRITPRGLSVAAIERYLARTEDA